MIAMGEETLIAADPRRMQADWDREASFERARIAVRRSQPDDGRMRLFDWCLVVFMLTLPAIVIFGHCWSMPA